MTVRTSNRGVFVFWIRDDFARHIQISLDTAKKVRIGNVKVTRVLGMQKSKPGKVLYGWINGRVGVDRGTS